MRIAIATIALAFAAVAVGAPKIPADKELIVFDTKIGKVTFLHQPHTGRSENCKTCHHTYESGPEIKACDECHGEKAKDDVPKIKDAVHLRCQGCHQENLEAGKPHGPLKKECKLCHIK